MSFSDYLENKVLDHIAGKTSFTMPANVHAALFVGSPLDTGAGGAEVSGSNYARVDTDSDWNAAASGSIDNVNAITFPQASGSWGTVDYFALFDASTAGNMLAWGALDSSKAVENGDTPTFAAGAFVITLD